MSDEDQPKSNAGSDAGSEQPKSNDGSEKPASNVGSSAGAQSEAETQAPGSQGGTEQPPASQASSAGTEKPQSNTGPSSGQQSNNGATEQQEASEGSSSSKKVSTNVQPSGSQAQASGSQVQHSGSQAQPSGSQAQASGSQTQPTGQVQTSGSQVQASGSQTQAQTAQGESESQVQGGTVNEGESVAQSASGTGSRTGSRTGSKARRSRPKRKKGEIVPLPNARIGVLGGGKIAEAMVRGMIQHTKLSPKNILVASKSGKTLDTFRQMGCIISKRFYDVFGKFDCDIAILALHGYAIRECYKMGGSRPMALTINYIPNQQHPIYVLSLIGGVTVLDIKNTLLNPEHPEKYQIELHRCMVNTSVAYGIGLAAIDVEPDSKKCSQQIRDLLTSFAKVDFVPEAHMDVVCSVAGNGLAFNYYFLTAISDGGFKMGLPKNVAVKLAAKVLQSASASLLESGKHPSDLRDQCTSPSGPAIYGIHVLDKQDCASGIAGAIESAFKRIKELAEQPHTTA